MLTEAFLTEENWTDRVLCCSYECYILFELIAIISRMQLTTKLQTNPNIYFISELCNCIFLCTWLQKSPHNRLRHTVNKYVLKLTWAGRQWELCVHTVHFFLSVKEYGQHRYERHLIGLSHHPALPFSSSHKELPLICPPQDCLCAAHYCHVVTILKLIVKVQKTLIFLLPNSRCHFFLVHLCFFLSLFLSTFQDNKYSLCS